ncbi:hypothetical protein [Rubripirellula lacrimiformis]|uniref:hypothetical protein n=1 Tax=Rubripirellula lacrimiformis TaxID=1930273 RepID=UPI001C54D649|nr:hypothetical protein [Rubripirellula lacrimiformis]
MSPLPSMDSVIGLTQASLRVSLGQTGLLPITITVCVQLTPDCSPRQHVSLA